MSPSSLLFRNVREKLSLCYSISAGYDAFRGALFVSCSLSAKNREIAEDEILGQVAALCEGRFGNDELEAARQSLCGAYRQLGDRPASLESFWAGRAMAGVAETPAECRQRFAALTRGDVIAAARRLSLNTVYFLRGTAPEETIVARIMQRDGIGEADARRRLAAQKSVEELEGRADYVIVNDDCPKDELIRRVDAVADALEKVRRAEYEDGEACACTDCKPDKEPEENANAEEDR